MEIDLGITEDFCQGEEIHDYEFEIKVFTANKIKIRSRLDIIED